MNRGVAALLAVLVVLAPIPLADTATGDATPDQVGPTIHRTTTLALTPDDPGSIDVTVTYTIPDSVSQLTTRLPPDSHSVTTDAFTNPGNTTWRWHDGNTTTPSLSFVLPANETGVGHNPEAEGRYLFVDAGSWAIVQVPPMPLQWLRSGPSVAFESTVEIEGSGATGGEMAYLGEYAEYTRTAHEQSVRLIVPTGARLAEPPSTILDAITSASDTLRVGERDDSIIFIAAPARIEWGARGLSGGSDAWVLSSEPLDTPENAWLHEYVHTRQSFETTTPTLWLTEAMATYYAAFLTLRQDRIDYAAFRTHLARGGDDPYVDTVLAEPRSWVQGTNYVKGALVWGAIDYQVRQSTDSRRAADDIFSRLNAETGSVTGVEFLEMVEAVAGPDTREFVSYYTTEPEAPSTWSRVDHQRVFGTEPPRMVVTFVDDGFDVTGPYRTLSTIPETVVVGETITVTASVRNDGEVTGEYEATLTLDGDPVATATVTVAPQTTETVELAYTAQSTGIHTVGVGPASFDVRVAEPATPTVTDLTINQSRVAPTEPVAVTATIENTAEWPGGEVAVTVDGEPKQSLDLTLAPGETTTETVVFAFNETGEHTVSIGNRSITVQVGDSPAQPGFDLPTTAVSLVILGFAWGLYRRYTTH